MTVATIDTDKSDPLKGAVRDAVGRAKLAREASEPSLASRLGQIGVLGWTILVPTLGGLFLGRYLDHRLHTGVFYSAPFLMVGVGCGFFIAWRWMHRQ